MAQVTLPSGITIEYERRGSGEPLLLVMGLAGQLIDWPVEFVDRLVEAGFEVVLYDNRDVGLSTKTDWEPPSARKTVGSMLMRRPVKGVGYTVDDMADDGAGLMDALGFESMHVVGMSMGGMISQALTINHPNKVRSLCSVMSNTGDRRNGGISLRLIRAMGLPKPPGSKETAVEDSLALWRHISGDHFDADETRQRAEAGLERSWCPEGVMRQAAAIGGSADRTAGLRKVTVPSLVIHGLKDLLVAPSGGTATAAAIPGSRLLMFPDMGHNLPEPRQDEMVAAIVRNTLRSSVGDGV
ncbi:MAG: alpha/beta fold hydrolase [Actinobacteria bacterium]|nr:alpha/beta fold hydrolase [Actinomycetota bacterium]